MDQIPGGVTAPQRIDVHAHYLPPAYRDALRAAGHAQPDGFPQLPEWSAEEHVQVMDRLGIARHGAGRADPSSRRGVAPLRH